MSCVYCRRCGRKTQQATTHRWCPKCQEPDYINPAPAVGVAILRGPRVLLAKRGAEPKLGQWDLIGGFVEPGETVPEAAHRETREETGMRITSLRRVLQAPGIYEPGKPTLNFIFAAEAEGAPKPGSDVAAVHWFELDRLPQLAWAHEEEALKRLRKEYHLKYVRQDLQKA